MEKKKHLFSGVVIILILLACMGNTASSLSVSDPVCISETMNHPAAEASLDNHSPDGAVEDFIDPSVSLLLQIDPSWSENISPAEFSIPAKIVYSIWQPPNVIRIIS